MKQRYFTLEKRKSNLERIKSCFSIDDFKKIKKANRLIKATDRKLNILKQLLK